MTFARLRLTLLTFAAPLALMGGAVHAQEAPPVASPSTQAPVPTLTPPADDQASPPATAPAAPVADPPIPAVWAPVPADAEGRTAYGYFLGGRYLAGRGAGAQAGAGREGSAALAEAERLVPEQPAVRTQAFTTAILMGDMDDAARTAPGPEASSFMRGAGQLVTAVQAFVHNDARRGNVALKADPIQPPHAVAALLIQPWIAAAARDWEAALKAPPATSNDQFSQVMRFQRAQLLEIRHRDAEAEAELQALGGGAAAQPALTLGYGEYLERHRRRDEAVRLYEAALIGQPNNASLKQARDRAASRGRAPRVTTPAQGVTRGLLLAAQWAADQQQSELAAVYTRLALNVTPADDIRLELGDRMVRAQLEGTARDVYAQISPNNRPLYAVARLFMAQSLVREDRGAEALIELRRAAEAAPTSEEIAFALAQQLLAQEKNDEALALLNGPVLKTDDQPAAVHFLRGAAMEASGDVSGAEAELQAALTLQPAEPAFLNYLGYLWVDSGARVEEGAAMIQRAAAADPTDGNIQDSLGWAQYRQGRFETAVATLEEAVTKEPANAEINDHLGDAYWQVGRRREAGWQWNRVLTLNPDAKRRAEVEAKLANGLAPAAAPNGAGEP